MRALGFEKQAVGIAFHTYNTVGLIMESYDLQAEMLHFFFYYTHASSFSKAAANITHNAT